MPEYEELMEELFDALLQDDTVICQDGITAGQIICCYTIHHNSDMAEHLPLASRQMINVYIPHHIVTCEKCHEMYRTGKIIDNIFGPVVYEKPERIN